ncbi:MAG: hypothetical protein LLG04_16120 [Parachlamydia sp.]|nr:hypothetical protein [Parachlamydia sp.]
MNKKRPVLIDDETEESLRTLCDTAIKFSGLHMAMIVADILSSLNESDAPLFGDVAEEW